MRWTDRTSPGIIPQGPLQPSTGVVVPNGSENLHLMQTFNSWSALYKKHTKSNTKELILSPITIKKDV